MLPFSDFNDREILTRAPRAPDDQTVWECSDCGWNLQKAQLVSGMDARSVRDLHLEKYCACPPTWPPS